MIEPMTGDKDTFRIEFHASLIPYPGDILDIEQFDSAVSTTLEDAKNIGLNNLYIYGEKDVRKLNREDYILDIIKDAIAKDKFEVFLQPILRISDRKPIGAEALLRLNDPARGYIPPSEFVPIAVKNNMMFEIEQYIIDSIGELWKAHGYEIFQQIPCSVCPSEQGNLCAVLGQHRHQHGRADLAAADPDPEKQAGLRRHHHCHHLHGHDHFAVSHAPAGRQAGGHQKPEENHCGLRPGHRVFLCDLRHSAPVRLQHRFLLHCRPFRHHRKPLLQRPDRRPERQRKP